MAGEEEEVSGLHLNSKSHEQQGVNAQGCGHFPANNAWVFLDVCYGRQRNTPVGNGSPKVSTAQVGPELFTSQLFYKLAGVPGHFFNVAKYRMGRFYPGATEDPRKQENMGIEQLKQ